MRSLGLVMAALVLAGAAEAATLNLRQADAKLRGSERKDSAGFALAGLGDVNGDARPDVGISVHGRRGGIYVLFGPLRRSDVTLKRRVARGHGFRIIGDRPLAVAAAGDVNGDGRADILVRALPRPVEEFRRVALPLYVVFGRRATRPVDVRRLGSEGFRIDGAVERHNAIVSAAGAEDVNGDGRADIAVSVPLADPPGRRRAGTVFVVFGRGGKERVDLNSLGTRGYRIQGSAGTAVAGPVALVRDVNGDQRAEVVHFCGPAACVVYGQASREAIDLGALAGLGYRIVGSDLHQLAAAGDVNRDGRGDVLLASTTEAGDVQNIGTVHVVFGRPGETVDLTRPGWSGYEAGVGYVTSLGDAGDVNGDGYTDAIVGTAVSDAGKNSERGSATILFGTPTRSHAFAGGLARLSIDSDAPHCACAARGSNVGASVSGAGDHNGDGRADVLIGAPQSSNLGRGKPGVAYLVYGPRVIAGTPGADRLSGSRGNDVVLGLGGADILSGAGGNDLVDGGRGADRLAGGAGDDKIEGGSDADVLNGGGGDDDLFGGHGWAFGEDDDYTVNRGRGPTGADRLLGGPGRDLLAGGDGADVLQGSGGADAAFGEGGNDRVSGGPGHDRLFGDGMADYDGRSLDLLGAAGRDRVVGGRGSDRLHGGFGSGDVLLGGRGNDRLKGGLGGVVDGGLGFDRYVGRPRGVRRLRSVEGRADVLVRPP
jgi:Ca2+-binding RTX toxin-like protein